MKELDVIGTYLLEGFRYILDASIISGNFSSLDLQGLSVDGLLKELPPKAHSRVSGHVFEKGILLEEALLPIDQLNVKIANHRRVFITILDELVLNVYFPYEYREALSESGLATQLAIHELKNSLELVLKDTPLDKRYHDLQVYIFRKEINRALYQTCEELE